MVVLVNSNTASSSEIVTAALQDHHRATVVGTHTFGKGVFQEEMPLSNGGALDITVGEYYTPDGRNLGGGGIKQGAGVQPEVNVAHGVDTPYGLAVALNTLAAKAQVRTTVVAVVQKRGRFGRRSRSLPGAALRTGTAPGWRGRAAVTRGSPDRARGHGCTVAQGGTVAAGELVLVQLGGPAVAGDGRARVVRRSGARTWRET